MHQRTGRPPKLTVTDLSGATVMMKITIPEAHNRTVSVFAAEMGTTKADVICLAIEALRRERTVSGR